MAVTSAQGQESLATWWKGLSEESRGNLLRDCFVSHTGDDIAILATHNKGVENEEVHKLAWDAFVAGTECAREQGLYGAGQDLLKDSFSGNVKGMGPAVAEMEIEERPERAVPVFCRGQDRPRRLQSAPLSGFCRPHVQLGPDPCARHVEGL